MQGIHCVLQVELKRKGKSDKIRCTQHEFARCRFSTHTLVNRKVRGVIIKERIFQHRYPFPFQLVQQIIIVLTLT